MLAMVLEKLKKLKILLARVPDVALPGAHTIQPIAMKLSQVVNILAMVLEKLKIILAWVPGVALSLQELTPFVRLQLNLHKLF